MADLSETSVFNPVTRIENTTVALGGDEVNSPNLQLKQLVDRDKWLRDQIEAITGAGSINTLARDVLQIAHGFSEKDPIYHNGANWVKSDAGSSTTAIATAIVSNVTDTDNFTLTLAGRITGLTGLIGGRIYYLADTGGISLTPGTIQRPVLVAESSTVGYFAPIYDFPTVESANVAQGRLTFTASTPVMTSDVLAATTLRYTPYIGDKITLWNSTRGHWQQYTFTERTLSLAGLAANTNFDVFIYDNAGTLTLEAIAWSNSGAGTSARASALSYRDGVRVKTSDDRKYLGCFRTTGTIGQSEFSTAAFPKKLFLWNEYHRVEFQANVFKSGTATYSYTTSTIRYAVNDSGLNVAFVSGISSRVKSEVTAHSRAGTTFGLGKNSASAFETGGGYVQFNGIENTENLDLATLSVSIPDGMPLGYNFLAFLEIGEAGASTLYSPGFKLGFSFVMEA